MKKILVVTLILALLMPSLASADTTEEEVAINAPSAILINAENGDILFEKNTEKVYDIASLTKVMTLLIASEEMKNGKLKETDMVEISKKAWMTGGSKMFLEVGTQHPVSEIFKGIAVVSGNDASVAMAEHIAETTDQFSDLMNKKAKDLNMKDTTFYSPNGLGLGNGKHFDTSTAKDLALLAKHYITTYPENMEIHSMTEYTTETRTHPITQQTNNGLLGEYKGATGLKTGMINGNFNLIATAKRGEANLVAIILGAKSPSERNNDAWRLLDYGFTQYTTINEGLKDDVVTSVPVYKAKDLKHVDLVLAEDLSFIVHIDDEENIKIEDIVPTHLKGGAKAGDAIGKRVVKVNDKTYEAKITIKEDIEKSGFIKGFFDSLALFFQWAVDMVFE